MGNPNDDGSDISPVVSADGHGEKGHNTTTVKTIPTLEKELFLGDEGLVSELRVTEEDLAEAKATADTMTLESLRHLMQNVMKIHEHDQNFPHSILIRIAEFLGNENVFENPEKHEDLIYEMKIEAALITNNSPYAEVRAVVENTDNVDIPCSTVRSWTIGIFFSVFLAFINQLFSIRQPPINIDSNVAQILAFPIGKAWALWMPDWRFTLFGTQHSLNPGPFSKKEHMLITIMANTAKSLPYTQYIIWTQVLPHFFNQQYARNMGYQLLIALSTNFIGYGLAGLTRRFLVYPSFCVWPASLVTIALNSALHNEENRTVPGPFKKVYSMSRYRFFMLAFGAMFVYFWFPNYLFESLTYFSWMTWISPNNHNLEVLTGFQRGLGLFNPWPTFDWNVLLFQAVDPLMVPAFSSFNVAGGMFTWGLIILAVYFTNTWNTGYLPVNSNRVYDHFGKLYNVTQTLNSRGMYDHEKYMNYSAAYLGAANTVLYGCFFGVYAAALTHVGLFHRYEIMMGLKSVWRTIRRQKKDQTTVEGIEGGEYVDIHNKLMAAYPEVSEWYYFSLLVVAAGLGFAGVCAWPTYTTAGVVPYGILLAAVFVIPVGIIKAMTGIEVTLNVLAEFIGGSWVQGNALAMNFFKSYGYVTCAHAVAFANDMKIAHYLKIPPRHTFAAQTIATLISTFVCVGVLQLQIDMKNVCLPNAPMRFFCPGINTFFTASVLWGTIGPVKVWGPKGQYGALLLCFPIGAITTVLFWLLVRRFPKNKYLRQVHVVAIWYGGINFAPYSFSYVWPSVPVAWLSWIYVKTRYLAFWSKYNFVLSAAFSAGIAISAIIMLFTVSWLEIAVPWRGNDQPYVGCEGPVPCTLKSLAAGERFYPWWGGKGIPAP